MTPYLSSRANKHRDHLERVHLHVQCFKCAQVFSGKPVDRVADLEAHHIAPEQCQLNPQREALREGISSAQWVRIADVIKNVNSSQGSRPAKPKTNVDKWMEIWDVLFLNEARPETPCKSNDSQLKQKANFHRVRRT